MLFACNFEYNLLHGGNNYDKTTIRTKIDLNVIYLTTPILKCLGVLVDEKWRIQCPKHQNVPKYT